MDVQANTSIIHITDEEFKTIVSFVYQHYGIDLSKKRQLIEGRLSYTLKTKGFTTFTPYFKELLKTNNSEEIQFFLNKITTNHSYFGRENDHFDYLLQKGLPQLERTRKNDLRIWSAGCSSGQEAYNIAMVMDQYFGSRKGAWDTTILATDISTNVLTKAKLGVYSAENLQGLPEHWIRQYFTKTSSGEYQVIEKIRKEVVYRIFNLMDTFSYKKQFDIIFCRNVMIYFDFETTQKMIEKFYQATAPGGYLMIGHSENLDRSSSQYEYIQPAIYQKPLRGGSR